MRIGSSIRKSEFGYGDRELFCLTIANKECQFKLSTGRTQAVVCEVDYE